MSYDHLNHEARRAIEGRVDAIFEHVIYDIENGNATDVDDCREIIHDMPYEDTLAIGLSHHDELTLVEHHADDYGWTLEGVSFSNLRGVLESHACAVIDDLARSEVIEYLEDLEDLIDDEDLDLEEMKDSSALGWVVHWAEKSIGDNCQVYQYRNVEGEVHVDVYEYKLGDYLVYFEKSIDEEDLSDEERAFNPHA